MGRSRNQAQPSTAASTDTPDEQVGRRALLRRAATVAAAGIGGVAAVEMLSAGPASATTGAMQFGNGGTGNSAGPDMTTLTSAAVDGATLEISHTDKIANLRLTPVDTAVDYGGSKPPNGDSGGVMLGGELINLTEQVTDPITSAVTTADTLFWMAGANGSADLKNLAVVLTTATGTVFAPVGPSRVLDTRDATLRTRLASQSVLDSSHRLIGGKTLELLLGDFVQFAYAVHFNLTSTGGTAAGFLTAFGAATRPLASNVNYRTGVTVANHGLSPLSANTSLFIYASKTSHVIVDIQGWTLPDFSFLLSNSPGIQAKTATSKQARPSVVRRMPNRTTGG